MSLLRVVVGVDVVLVVLIYCILSTENVGAVCNSWWSKFKKTRQTIKIHATTVRRRCLCRPCLDPSISSRNRLHIVLVGVVGCIVQKDWIVLVTICRMIKATRMNSTTKRLLSGSGDVHYLGFVGQVAVKSRLLMAIWPTILR